jgi:hypothetical protein
LSTPSNDESTILLWQRDCGRCSKTGEDTVDEQEKLSNATAGEGRKEKEEEG